MPAEVQPSFSVPCRDVQGRVLATVQIWSTRKPNGRDGEVADLIRWPDAEAEARGEEPVQLRERGRYIYKILEGEGIALEESPAISRSPAEQPGAATEGGLPGIAARMVAVSCGRTARMGWRTRSLAGRREECRDAL